MEQGSYKEAMTKIWEGSGSGKKLGASDEKSKTGNSRSDSASRLARVKEMSARKSGCAEFNSSDGTTPKEKELNQKAKALQKDLDGTKGFAISLEGASSMD